MKRITWLAVASIVVGCAPPAVEKETPAPAAVAASREREKLDIPDFVGTSRLGVVRQGETVRVGMLYDDALAVFPSPLGSSASADLPPSIPAPYEARGWQTKADAFGAILYKGRIAAAIYEVDRTTDDRVAEMVRQYEAAFGPSTASFPGMFVRYWFWQLPGDPYGSIAMICASEIQQGKFDVAAAAGTKTVMDALGMTPDAASVEGRAADRILFKQRNTKTRK